MSHWKIKNLSKIKGLRSIHTHVHIIFSISDMADYLFNMEACPKLCHVFYHIHD